jgi:hypothetical protein
MTHSALTAQVTVRTRSVDVAVSDPRPDTLKTFEALSAPQREQLAHDAWHVGLRALMNAYRQAEEARLEDIGKTLSNDLDEQLRQHADAQEKAIKTALGRYFDPEGGELGTRLRQFMGDEGVLVHLLQQHLGPRNSVLVETLTKHVGEQSPLFRRLSPTDSEGLVCILGERLRHVLQEEHGEFQKALNPLQEGGAVGLFIGRLREELKRAEDDQAKQLKIALAALDTTEEGSLLNQLRRDTQQARTELLQAINPAREGSPLAIIKTSLCELLAQYATTTQERLEAAQKQNAEFQRDVRDAVQRIETRRREDQRSVRGGGVFEDAVAEFTQNHLGSGGYIVETTGNVVGLRPNCKVGDLVIEFPADHAFAGNRVVIEAKRDKSYTLSRALDEIATARKNRDAGAGIFVLARSHASAGFPTFSRYGRDIIVLWDDEAPSSDPYLQAALMLALGLATRNKSTVDEGDLQALQGVEQRLVQELKRLDKIRKAAETIRKQADAIDKEVATGEGKLGKILEDARKTLTALNVELRDEELERVSPIEVDIGGEVVENDVGAVAEAGE